MQIYVESKLAVVLFNNILASILNFFILNNKTHLVIFRTWHGYPI